MSPFTGLDADGTFGEHQAMPRQARLVVPGVPHHLTQRGNRRQRTFFCDDDYQTYIEIAAEAFANAAVEVWAYCLMPNHVHLIAVPATPEGLAEAMGIAHQKYSLLINRREGWTVFLWQGRFASFPMDDGYLLNCARYVAFNPVRAGLAERPEDWRWSSARAHIEGRRCRLAPRGPLLARCGGDIASVLSEDAGQIETTVMRAATRSGRPTGAEAWVKSLEDSLGRTLTSAPRGRPRKAHASVNGDMHYFPGATPPLP